MPQQHPEQVSLTEGVKIGELQTADFPGDMDWLNLRIHITEDAHQQILKHAQENFSIELCGILVGVVNKDDKGSFVDIHHIVRADRADGHVAQVTITHEAWNDIFAKMQQDYPNEKIVGWYHTHPGFGIFLSTMDMFIHQNFFNLPWQVAFVIDPKTNEEGFFVWQNGDIKKITAYWNNGSLALSDKEQQSMVSNEDRGLSRLEGHIEDLGIQVRSLRFQIWSLWGLVALATIVGITFFYRINIFTFWRK